MADDAISESMAFHSEQAVADAKRVHGIDLDYTPESIEQVETLLSAVYDSKPRGLMSRLFHRSVSADEVAQLATIYGSYVGESLIRKWGGHWCYRRLMNGPEDKVWHKVLAIYLTD